MQAPWGSAFPSVCCWDEGDRGAGEFSVTSAELCGSLSPAPSQAGSTHAGSLWDALGAGSQLSRRCRDEWGGQGSKGDPGVPGLRGGGRPPGSGRSPTPGSRELTGGAAASLPVPAQDATAPSASAQPGLRRAPVPHAGSPGQALVRHLPGRARGRTGCPGPAAQSPGLPEHCQCESLPAHGCGRLLRPAWRPVLRVHDSRQP